jgi:hypothetical protein
MTLLLLSPKPKKKRPTCILRPGNLEGHSFKLLTKPIDLL